MSTTTDLSTLKINYLTQAQYDTALANNQINANELYFTPSGGSFGIGGDAREGSALYVETSSPYTPNLQLKRQNASMLSLAVKDNGYLELINVPYVDGEDDWDNATLLWSVQMRRLSNHNPIAVSSATVSSSYSGSCSYVKNGHLVTFDAIIATTGALSNGTVLATGLPANHITNSIFYAFNNNSSTENIPLYVTSSGVLSVRGSFAASSRSIRVSGSYLSAS